MINEVVEQIKAVMKKKGITTLQLARACNMSNAMLSRLFSGEKKVATFTTINRICGALRIEVKKIEFVDKDE